MASRGRQSAPFGEVLRRDAEMRVQAHGRQIAPPTVEDLQFAVQELHIYEAELQIQNEELLDGRARVEESEQKYFRHFDLAPVGLVRLNTAGVVVEANILGAQMLGVNRAQFYLTSRPFLAHVARDSQGVFQQHFEDALEFGKLQSCELTLRATSGSETFVRMQSVRSRGERGGAELYVTLTDLTSRRRLEDDLAAQKLVADAATLVAESAKLAKEQFFAMLSHELRTPLTPVIVLLSELEATPGRGLEERAALATMRRNLELETQLVDDLLDLTRITNGKLKLQREPTDVNLCLAQAVEVCGAGLDAKELFLELDLGAARHFADADGKRLQQVFWNILANAVKFTPRGGRISLSTSNAGERLAIEFHDTGFGIETAAIERIFDPFAQADESVTRRFGGLGLGLAISRSIAEAHGGSLSVTSPGVGQGSTFRFEIPTLVEPAGGVRAGRVKVAPAAPRKNLRLLLVEDHDDTRDVLQQSLQRRGYEVKSARDAASAREQCATHKFDLMITDLQLPDSNGRELLRELSRVYGLRGIALSGLGTDEDLVESKGAGFLEHFVKPLDLSALDEAIQRAAPAEFDSETVETVTALPLSQPAQRVSEGSANFLAEPFPVAYRFAFCMTLAHDRAAELTEAVFAKARRSLGEGASPATDRRWLLTELHREWAAQGASETHGPTGEVVPKTDGLLITAGHAAQCDPTTVMTVVNGMPTQFRLVLALHYLEQLGYADIALILGLPNETVMSRLAEAKPRLRRELEAQRRQDGAS